MANHEVQARELAHHEEVYSGFAQQHFAKPAVRAFRAHLVDHVLGVTGTTAKARVLSIGCGIGDTELLMAPRVARVTGLDLSPRAIRQARADTQAAGVGNAEFLQGDLDSAPIEDESFELIVAVFLLHHLADDELAATAASVARLLAPGGAFYAIDPSRYRLAGAIGRTVAPALMAKHQSPDERELVPEATRDLFANTGLRASASLYDFGSTPVAGLFPGSAPLYKLARAADDVLIRIPLVRWLGSNFEILARKESGTTP